jgi:hypothetical protein
VPNGQHQQPGQQYRIEIEPRQQFTRRGCGTTVGQLLQHGRIPRCQIFNDDTGFNDRIKSMTPWFMTAQMATRSPSFAERGFDHFLVLLDSFTARANRANNLVAQLHGDSVRDAQ